MSCFVRIYLSVYLFIFQYYENFRWKNTKKYCRFPAIPHTRDPKRISFAFHYLHTGIIFVPSSVDALISTAERWVLIDWHITKLFMTILSQELFIIVDKLIQKQSDIERRSERKLFKMKHHFKILNFLLLLRYFQFPLRAGDGGFVFIGRSFLIPAVTSALS